MKNGLHANPFLIKAAVLLTCFMLVMMYNKSKAAIPQQAKQHTVLSASS